MPDLTPYQVILRPLVTEKGTRLVQTTNSYNFQVHPTANKTQIKHAVERIYNVKVEEVRTLNRRGKPRRAGYRWSDAGAWKKAIVKLKADYSIDLF